MRIKRERVSYSAGGLSWRGRAEEVLDKASTVTVTNDMAVDLSMCNMQYCHYVCNGLGDIKAAQLGTGMRRVFWQTSTSDANMQRQAGIDASKDNFDGEVVFGPFAGALGIVEASNPAGRRLKHVSRSQSWLQSQWSKQRLAYTVLTERLRLMSPSPESALPPVENHDPIRQAQTINSLQIKPQVMMGILFAVCMRARC